MTLTKPATPHLTQEGTNANSKPERHSPPGLVDQVLSGDCVHVLKSIADESVDFALTDPPYLVRYRDRQGRTIANDGNPAAVLLAFDEIYRVLKADSLCVSFYGWNAADAFLQAWRRAGFRPVGHIVWSKGYASGTGFLKARHEQAYVLAKGRPARPSTPIDDVRPWEYTGNRLHPTEKAVSVLQPLIKSFSRPGDVVLDPFAGSGSTLVAAALCGRRYLGVELEESYCTLAARRLAGVSRFMKTAIA